MARRGTAAPNRLDELAKLVVLDDARVRVAVGDEDVALGIPADIGGTAKRVRLRVGRRRARRGPRLETLDLSLYKKVDFAPGPVPAGSFCGDVLAWARYTLRPPRGRAIVFADAHVGLDLDRLGPASVGPVGPGRPVNAFASGSYS